METKNDNSYMIARVLLKIFVLLRPRKIDCVLKPVEFMVVMCIHRNHQLGCNTTPTVICNELGLSKSNLTNILNKLENLGYIKREISQDNRRNVLIELTSKSEDIHEQFHERMDKTMAELTECLGADVSDNLLDILNKIYQFAEERERR